MCIVLLPWTRAAAQTDTPTEVPPTPAAESSSTSEPPGVQQCVEAHERAQVLRIDGRLIESRSALGACAHEACPDPLKHDCVTWREEVSQQIPTVILEALTNHGAASQVIVSVGDRVLVRVLDGRPLELDPGHYEFRFELPDGSSEVVAAMVKPGNRNVVVSADFRKEEPVVSSPTPAPPPQPVQSIPPPAPQAPLYRDPAPRMIPMGSYVLGGLAVASAGVAVGLGLSTNTKERNSREDCAPHCSAERVDEITTLALLTDISIGVALTSAVGAALIYAFSNDQPPSTVAVQPAVSYAPGGATYAGIRGSF